MICPSCHLYISNPDAEMCPRCGQPQFDMPDRAQEYEQPPQEPTYRPTTPAPRPTSGGFSSYDSQPYADQSYSGQRSSGQAYQPGYGGQRFQPTFSAPATPRWTPPIEPRQTSKARRVLLYILSTTLLFALCVGCTFLLVLLQASHKGSLATATPFPGTTPGATILFQDPLTDDTNGWGDTNGNCFFQAGSYHIKDDYICYAPAGIIGDATISVQAKQVAGSPVQPYGIVFRRTSTGNWYEFDIDSNSTWGFGKAVNGTWFALVTPTPNAAIKGGLSTTNTLSVQARGAHFVFFVNGTQVGEADDGTFASGQAGLSAGGLGTEVAYNNFQVTVAS